MSSSLLCLPNELILRVVSYGDYASTVASSLTCRSMHARLAGKKDQQFDMADLLHIERWPCYNGAAGEEGRLAQPFANRDYFACHICLRIRSAIKFSNAMMKGKRGKLSPGSDSLTSERLTRFCIDCGIRTGRYIAGTTFRFGGGFGSLDESAGGYGLVCRRCCNFVRIPLRSTGQPSRCSSCIDDAAWRNIT